MFEVYYKGKSMLSINNQITKVDELKLRERSNNCCAKPCPQCLLDLPILTRYIE